jgi:hypothetical protein
VQALFWINGVMLVFYQFVPGGFLADQAVLAEFHKAFLIDLLLQDPSSDADYGSLTQLSG